jgi:hypothetical protein
MIVRQTCGILFGLVVVALSAGVGTAHHSAALFEDFEAAARGTVVEVTWRNPHVLLHWDAKDQNGKVVRWVGEMASVSSIMADGLTRNSLKPGDEIVVTYRPARAGTPESVIGSILRPDGTIVLPWGRQGGGSDAERAKRAEERVKLLAPFGIKVTQ